MSLFHCSTDLWVDCWTLEGVNNNPPGRVRLGLAQEENDDVQEPLTRLEERGVDALYLVVG